MAPPISAEPEDLNTPLNHSYSKIEEGFNPTQSESGEDEWVLVKKGAPLVKATAKTEPSIKTENTFASLAPKKSPDYDPVKPKKKRRKRKKHNIKKDKERETEEEKLEEALKTIKNGKLPGETASPKEINKLLKLPDSMIVVMAAGNEEGDGDQTTLETVESEEAREEITDETHIEIDIETPDTSEHGDPPPPNSAESQPSWQWRKIAPGIFIGVLSTVGALTGTTPTLLVLTADSVIDAFKNGDGTVFKDVIGLLTTKNWWQAIAALFAGVCGTVALTPFSAKNNHSFYTKLSQKDIKYVMWELAKIVALGLPSGILNGLNTITSWQQLLDLFGDSIPNQSLAYYIIIFLSSYFPGVGNQNAFFEFLNTELARHWRDIKRSPADIFATLKELASPTESQPSGGDEETGQAYRAPREDTPLIGNKTKKAMLRDIRGWLDQLIARFELNIPGDQLKDWLDTETNADDPDIRNKFFQMHQEYPDLPLWKNIASYLTAWSVPVITGFGVFNNFAYAQSCYKALLIGLIKLVLSPVSGYDTLKDLLSALPYGVESASFLLDIMAYTSTIAGTGINAGVWYYLFRENIFKPLLRFLSPGENTANFKRLIPAIFCALCVGVSNLVVTLKNPEISALWLELAVALASILGNTALTVTGFMDIEKCLAILKKLTEAIYDYYASLDEETLRPEYNNLKLIFEQPAGPAPELPLENLDDTCYRPDPKGHM